MKCFPLLLVIASFCTHLWASPPVPYSGKVAIDGVNFFGTANFAFEIRDAQGTVHWRNGATPHDTIAVSVANGRYFVQLGGQGMNPLAPDLFLAHDELYINIRFDPGDGKGIRLLGPDQRITATPYALTADLARLAQGVPPGSITREMLANSVLSDLNNSGGGGGSSYQVTPGSITLDLLSAEVQSRLDANSSGGASGPVTRAMLASDVLSDLNRTITRSDLPASVLADLNRTITKSNLGSDVLNDLNSSISLNRLSPEVLAALQVTPSISTQPFARFDWRTNSAVIEATGRGHNLSYQWLKNGQPINGATGPVLEIANASLSDGATFAVRLTNSVGQTTSQPLTLQQAIGAPGPPLVEANSTQVPRNGLVLWMDASDLNADGHADSLLVGDRVTSWTDKITEKNATQSDLNKQPVKATNGSVSFDGSDSLGISDLNVTALHILLVANGRQLSGSLLKGNGGNNSLEFQANKIFSNSASNGKRVFPWNTGTIRISGGPNVFSANSRFTASVTRGNSENSTGHFLELLIGNNFDGEIHEVLFYDRLLQNSERDAVERYLADKWSVTLHQEPQPLPEQPETGLLGRWTFDEGSGDVVHDVSGNQNHGTLEQTTESDVWKLGASGKAIDLDGFDDQFVIDAKNREHKTMTFWFNAGFALDPSGSPVRILRSHVGGNHDESIWLNDWNSSLSGEIITIRRDDGATTYVMHQNANLTGGWNHFAMSWDGGLSRYRIFLNGVEAVVQASPTGHFSFTGSRSSQHVFGKQPVGGGDARYAGKLDDFRIYARSLSDAEIRALCDQDGDGLNDLHEAELGTNPNLADTDGDGDHDRNETVAGSSPTNPNETIISKALATGLQVHLKFDETNGTTAYDSSGNSRYAELHGFDGNGSTWINGKIGGALNFDGVNDWGTISYNIPKRKNFAMAMWLKSTTNFGNNTFGWNQRMGILSGPADTYGMFLNIGKFNFMVGPENSGHKVRFSSASNVNSGIWFHLVVFRETSGAGDWGTYYSALNGSVVGIGNKQFSASTGSLLYLGKTQAGSAYFLGTLDDLRIYDRVLNTGEIQALYQLGN